MIKHNPDPARIRSPNLPVVSQLSPPILFHLVCSYCQPARLATGKSHEMRVKWQLQSTPNVPAKDQKYIVNQLCGYDNLIKLAKTHNRPGNSEIGKAKSETSA